nr:MAG TPA: hypothetical protein [Caudoviricetes sp.]
MQVSSCGVHNAPQLHTVNKYRYSENLHTIYNFAVVKFHLFFRVEYLYRFKSFIRAHEKYRYLFRICNCMLKTKVI